MRIKKKFLFLGILCLSILIPHQINLNRAPDENLNVSIIQPSLDPFKKYMAGSQLDIEDTLIDLTNNSSDADLIIWPESPLPYLESNPRMNQLISRIEEGLTVLSGSWKYTDNKMHNSMTILGSDQTYLKASCTFWRICTF